MYFINPATPLLPPSSPPLDAPNIRLGPDIITILFLSLQVPPYIHSVSFYHYIYTLSRYLFIYLFRFSSIYLSRYLSYIYPYIFVEINTHLYVQISISLSNFLSIYLSIYLSRCLSIFLDIYSSIFLECYLSILIYIYPSIHLPSTLLSIKGSRLWKDINLGITIFLDRFILCQNINTRMESNIRIEKIIKARNTTKEFFATT